MLNIRQFLSTRRFVTSFLSLKRAPLCNINYSTKDIEDEDDNKPIKYSTSPASRWQAEFSRTGIPDTRLWYEPYVIIASVSVFLIYFCILREESDVDMELGKTLYQRIDGLEEQQLRIVLNYNVKNGLETKEIIDRLHEIEESKRKM